MITGGRTQQLQGAQGGSTHRCLQVCPSTAFCSSKARLCFRAHLCTSPTQAACRSHENTCQQRGSHSTGTACGAFVRQDWAVPPLLPPTFRKLPALALLGGGVLCCLQGERGEVNISLGYVFFWGWIFQNLARAMATGKVRVWQWRGVRGGAPCVARSGWGWHRRVTMLLTSQVVRFLPLLSQFKMASINLFKNRWN